MSLEPEPLYFLVHVKHDTLALLYELSLIGAFQVVSCAAHILYQMRPSIGMLDLTDRMQTMVKVTLEKIISSAKQAVLA